MQQVLLMLVLLLLETVLGKWQAVLEETCGTGRRSQVGGSRHCAAASRLETEDSTTLGSDRLDDGRGATGTAVKMDTTCRTSRRRRARPTLPGPVLAPGQVGRVAVIRFGSSATSPTAPPAIST